MSVSLVFSAEIPYRAFLINVTHFPMDDFRGFFVPLFIEIRRCVQTVDSDADADDSLSSISR